MKSSHFEIVQKKSINRNKANWQGKKYGCYLQHSINFSVDLKFFKIRLKNYRMVLIDAINILSDIVFMVQFQFCKKKKKLYRYINKYVRVMLAAITKGPKMQGLNQDRSLFFARVAVQLNEPDQQAALLHLDFQGLWLTMVLLSSTCDFPSCYLSS